MRKGALGASDPRGHYVLPDFFIFLSVVTFKNVHFKEWTPTPDNPLHTSTSTRPFANNVVALYLFLFSSLNFTSSSTYATICLALLRGLCSRAMRSMFPFYREVPSKKQALRK